MLHYILSEQSSDINNTFIAQMSSPLCVNRGTHLYPESTTLITEIEATGVQLKPETHMCGVL